jgi:nicotinate-nucleotide adenylyltransferase
MNMQQMVIFGGTFNPIHNGHIAIIEHIHQLLNTDICLVLTKNPDYKQQLTISDNHRLAMLKLATQDYNYCYIDASELNADSYCYTYKSLLQLRHKIGIDSKLYFVIGSDSLINLHSWHYWNQLLKLTNFIVLLRKNFAINHIKNNLLANVFASNRIDGVDTQHSNGKFYLLNFMPPDISSSQIRNLILHNRDVHQYINPLVKQYIQQHKLYY